MIELIITSAVIQAILSLVILSIGAVNFHDHNGYDSRHRKKRDKQWVKVGVLGFIGSPVAVATIPGFILFLIFYTVKRAVQGIIRILKWEETW